MKNLKSSVSTECIVPSTLDGWSALHEFYSVDWARWNALDEATKNKIMSQATECFEGLTSPDKGHSGWFSVLGHKADLMFLHFRPSFDDLNQVELRIKQLDLYAYLRPTTSYVSIVELGMYAMTQKIHDELLEMGLKPDSDPWKAAWQERMQDQYNRMGGRIFCEIPKERYVCFYPMDKRRGEKYNWYTESMDDRARMMYEHGMVGRKYAGRIQQIISGSIGSDDWEWGVDLFAADPNVFKELIYEMRFDEASAHYAEFGPFYTALQFEAKDFGQFMQGQTPELKK